MIRVPVLCQGWIMIMNCPAWGWHLWSPFRARVFQVLSSFVVRGWMVGEKKEDEASSVVAGRLLVALRLGLGVLASWAWLWLRSWSVT